MKEITVTIKLTVPDNITKPMIAGYFIDADKGLNERLHEHLKGDEVLFNGFTVEENKE